MLDRDKPCYLTPAGKRTLERELEELRSVRRPALLESIRQLHQSGGAVETELDEFMNEQAHLDGHIKDLEFMLRHAIMVDEDAGKDQVGIGSQVLVRDGQGEEIHWTIVGSAEANARQGKISNESLVGAGLIGHRPGEVVRVQAPGGLQEYTILKIE